MLQPLVLPIDEASGWSFLAHGKTKRSAGALTVGVRVEEGSLRVIGAWSDVDRGVRTSYSVISDEPLTIARLLTLAYQARKHGLA